MSYMTRYNDLGGITDTASVAASVMEDPCLSKVTKLISDLRTIEAQTFPGLPSAPSTPIRGVGLCKAVKPLEAIVYLKRRPWVLPLAGAAVVGGLLALGYFLGKRRK